ncbi:MAG: hypothetical protein VYC41_01545 [Planctomycetota bacterium]|nr:hypothetical protein [Planctomycetota bacterium]
MLLAFVLMCIPDFSNWDAIPISASPGGRPIASRLLRPVDTSTPKPLLVVLHGMGERGIDSTSALKYLPKLMDTPKRRRDFPCYVFVPQCPPNETWSVISRTQISAAPFGDFPEPPMAAVEQGILDILATENVDASRIYLCGLSMGGFGTWDLLSRRPEWFAAAGPICGGANQIHAPRYVGRPIWNWHGAADEIVSVALSDHILQAIRQLGGDPKESRLPAVRHNSWRNAHADGQLVDWMFTQRLVPADSAKGARAMLQSRFSARPVSVHVKADALLQPAMEALAALPEITIVDREPIAGDVILLSPRGNLNEIAKLRQVLAQKQVHLVLLTEPQHQNESPNAERRSWAVRHQARTQAIPLADIRTAASSALPVWSHLGVNIVAEAALTESGSALAVRTIAETLIKVVQP